MSKQIKVIMYYKYINKIGGIETWMYNLCLALRDYYDVTLMFDGADINQLAKFYPYVKMEQVDSSKKYEADVVINNSNWVLFPKNITANTIYTIIHCDYKEAIKLGIRPMLEPNHKFVCIMDFAMKNFVEMFHAECDVIEGLCIPNKKPHKILHLVSCSRLSGEKGGMRMKRFMQELREKGVRFDWKIFTNDVFQLQSEFPEVTIMKPQMDVSDYMADADYLVQLSDTEALCCSVREALTYGTPVIVTDIPAFEYVVDGKMGYKVNLDMSNLDVEKYYKTIPKVNWHEDNEAIIKQWFEKIGEPVKIVRPVDDNDKKVKIRALIDYTDIVLNKFIQKGTIMEVTRERAFVLSHTDGTRPVIAEVLEDK